MKLLNFLILSVLVSCSQSNESPENLATNVLRSYVDTFFKVKSIGDIQNLTKLTSTSLKDELLKIDQKMFDEIFVKSQLEFKGFKIRDRRQVGENRYSFIYEIQMVSMRGGRHTEINKKIAFVTKDGANNWTLAEVRNINSTISYSNEMSIVP